MRAGKWMMMHRWMRFDVEMNRLDICQQARATKVSIEAGWQREEIRKPLMCLDEKRREKINSDDIAPTFA
jgi:hypothetical protein